MKLSSLSGVQAMTKALDAKREQRLIREAAAGNRDAAATLIKAHQGSVYSYILRLSGRSDVAEDVVQEAFVRVLTNLDRFDPRFRFSTWLFTIARRVYLNACEKKKPRSDTDGMEERIGHVPPGARGMETEEQHGVCRDAVQRALLTLSLDQREVVVLFHQHEWPIWLIAEHLDMPEGTVKSYLHRARVKLRDSLAEFAQANGFGAAPTKGATDDEESRQEQLRARVASREAVR